MRTVRSRESVSSAFRRSLAVRSLVLRHPRHIQGSCGYGPASCMVCCCSDSLLLWICSQAERNSQLPGSGSKRRWYEAYLVSFGARQRLAACDSSPGGCRNPGTYCRYQTKTRGRSGIRRDKQFASGDAQYAADKPDNDLMFIFGADIKTAGTASIVISVCLVTSGLWRYWRAGGKED